MLRPDNMVKYPEVDLKLGIKSSLPSVKATLGLLMMFWKASNNPDELAYSKAAGNSIEVSDDLGARLIEKYSPIYSSVGISDEQFLERVNDNQLFKSQLESLIVAFELIWRVAKIKFDNDMPASSERTGGRRYPKTLLFTKNMDILDAVLSSDDEQYSKVLLSWIGFNITVESKFEATLLQLLVYISEEAVYKLADGEQDIIFNMNSVYLKLLEEQDSAVDINDSKEAKGSLRILKSALSDKLNPFLTYSNANGVAIKDGLEDKLRAYQKRVDAYLSLSNTKYVLEPEIVDTENLYTQEGLNEYAHEVARETGGRNILLYGVPGSGKSYTIETNYCNDFSLMERVVFHPDYMNTDFVGQILPTVKGEGDEKEITYDFTPGPFTRVLKKAINDPGKHYYLVIEEINRGNAPAIFGEIFQLLDRESDGTSSYKITNYNIASEVFGNKETPVFIPSNLSILATMNTADQNVFTLDTAFQRRWDMKMIENDVTKAEHAKTKILDTTVTWEKFNTVVNEQIITSGATTLSSEDKRLGSYFVTEDVLKYFTMETDKNEIAEKYNIDLENGQELERKIKDLNSRFGDKVIKYLWDDVFKFSRDDLFESTYKSLEKVLYDFNRYDGDRRFDIFKQDIKDNLFSGNNIEETRNE
ncbi:AAA family ATPase [Clostridium tepidum]|uniref:AAA family ATPase n=1 Tax=Clostridium tepidum TaxID=1962263 RepID=UPI0018AC7934|nr:AAA family ATPase [Clostridium tepidum]